MSLRRWSSVSRHIVLGVAIELTAVSLVLSWQFGFGVWMSLMLSILLMLAMRCLLPVLSFLFAWWLRPEGGQRVTLSMRQFSVMVVREIGASMKLFLYCHPFEAYLNAHDAAPPAAQQWENPVLFVHGFYTNAGFWLQYKRYFRDHGIDALYTINLDPPFCDIDRYADQLAQRIMEVCAHAGRERVVLVAHSMGGLVCRACLARYGDQHVQQLITIGTPHHGTVFAHLLPGPNMRQMRPGNAWLEHLNNRQKALSISNLFSLHDNIVVPPESARVFGAKELIFNGTGHMSMAFSTGMQHAIVGDLITPNSDKIRSRGQG